MNEAETRAELIDPKLKAAGWGVVEGSRIRREYPITLGRLQGGGKRGKTSIAFQFVWKLFEAKWNLSGAPTRSPRVLFLADRNNLASQAFNDFNAFGAFEEKALVRISPEEIRKKKSTPKNGAVFFTIFQTFMSGKDAEGEPAPYFGSYPKDFFDCIIIDECHRGGAKDESEWRNILNYFEPALQLGLTATPKRKLNADTYAYFGEPVYVYSLKQGINDGFLTPFRVRQIGTTLDEYVYTPDDEVVEGDVEEGKRYTEKDFNVTIEIEARERARVRIFMDEIDQRQKTLVFCASQAHAAFVRDLINQVKTSKAGIKAEYGGALQSFLEFVLGEYVRQGDEELWPDKLGSLIALKYGTAKQAAKSLGGGTAIRDAFIGFQHHLYEG